MTNYASKTRTQFSRKRWWQGKKRKMETFKQLEKGFFRIDENDDLSIIKYFYDNKDYFITTDIKDKEIGQKNLWMISEIANSAYKQKDFKLFKMIVKHAITTFKDYSLLHNYDLKSDTFYKSLIYDVAIDSFNREKYYLAIKYFKTLLQFDKTDFRLLDFYNVSKYKYIKGLSRIFGLIGLSMIIIDYSLKYLIDFKGFESVIWGYLGAILLMTYGLIEMTIKSPATNKGSQPMRD